MQTRTPPFGQAGIPRMVLTAVLGGVAAGIWIGAALDVPTGTRLIVGAFVTGVVVILVPVLFFLFWRREGGRRSSAEIDGWVRAKQLPPESVPEESRGRLEKRAERSARFWPNVFLAALWTMYGVGQLLAHPDVWQVVASSCFIGLWWTLLGASAYSRFHTLPILKSLLTDIELRELVS